MEYYVIVLWNLRCVGNVFWLPIRQNKFFGTIEFLVSIYGKNLVILSPNLVFSYRSLDLNIFKFAAPLHLGKYLIYVC